MHFDLVICIVLRSTTILYWVRVVRLPLHLWSREVFRELESVVGGL